MQTPICFLFIMFDNSGHFFKDYDYLISIGKGYMLEDPVFMTNGNHWLLYVFEVEKKDGLNIRNRSFPLEFDPSILN